MIAEQLGQICSLLNRPVILLGGKDEKDKGEAILLHTTNPHVTNSCGRLSIAGSASVVRQAAVVLSHDTGMMHIAAALHRPQVVVWGNTVPQFGMYPYYGSSSATWISIERQGLSCRPCSKIGYTKCPKGHFACMLDHDLKTIVEALHSLWN